MGAKELNKGKRGEREAAKAVVAKWGGQARRGKQYAGDESAPDVISSIPNIHLEVKREERLGIRTTWEKHVATSGDKTPVILHRWNRGQWLVTMRLDDSLALLAAIIEGMNDA